MLRVSQQHGVHAAREVPDEGVAQQKSRRTLGVKLMKLWSKKSPDDALSRLVAAPVRVSAQWASEGSLD